MNGEAPTSFQSGSRSSFGFRDVDADEKVRLVRGVFERVAGRYDLMNDLMSAGAHRLWKDAAAARINPQPGEAILDCAGGTGDMARRLLRLGTEAARRRGGPNPTVTVADYNAEMVGQGRRRADRGADLDLSWCVGDAQRLPFPDRSFDAYVIAFGIRNVASLEAALAEARRVLRPGGRFLCLEFSRPVTAFLRRAYDLYSFRAIPALGGWVAGDSDSYRYLVESIRRFPDQERFLAMMARAGLSGGGFVNFSGGVVAMHTAWAD